MASTVALAAVLFLHLWQLGDVPKGLYSDESSIGLNAWLIASEGVDEYGREFPLFFEAFGEYKNPLYVYMTAVVFKFVAPSPFSLRLTSALCWLLFLLGLCWLGRRLFSGNPWLTLYFILAGGTLPWLFTYSRISFEVISQPVMFMFALVFIHKTFHREGVNEKLAWVNPLLAGVFTGLSIYTYTSSRLLTVGFVLLVLIIYLRRATLKSSLVFIGAVALSVLPFGIFSVQHMDVMTRRNYTDQSYLFNDALSIWEKIKLFFEAYVSHFDPGFLLIHGDKNFRHATGVGGELFYIVAALVLIAVPFILYKKLYRDKAVLLLLAGLLIAPSASAFSLNPPHATRSLLLGMFILILSGYGLLALLGLQRVWLKGLLILAVMSALVAEAFLYSQDYFQGYVHRSMAWFESSDLAAILKVAYDQQPKTIVLGWEPQYKQVPTQLAFHLLFVPPPKGIEVKMGDPIIRQDSCLILFSQSDADYENPDLLPLKTLPPITENMLMLKCA